MLLRHCVGVGVAYCTGIAIVGLLNIEYEKCKSDNSFADKLLEI